MAEERVLTAGERQLCEKVFRNSIPTSMVRVIKRPVGRGGFTPFHNIRMSEGSYRADYIGENLLKPPDAKKAHFFLHELAHVWQYFVGMPKVTMFFRGRRVARRVLKEKKNSIDLDTYYGDAALYDYLIDPSRPDLLDYSLEFQAEIIADYFAWTLWSLTPEFKWTDWPKPTVGRLLDVLSEFSRDPSYPRYETRGNTRRANRRH